MYSTFKWPNFRGAYTGIKTNLLFFNKGEPTKDVWFFEHPYPEGIKNYNKTKPINIKEFDLEKDWWSEREENKYSWKVGIEEIKKRNYNLDFKNPKVLKIGESLSSEALIKKLEASFEKSKQLLNLLKG